MIYTLPLYSDKTARWTSQIDLGDKRYMLYFSWNSRCEYWEFSIFNDNKKLIVGGIRLVTGIDLLDEYRNYSIELPTGRLQVVPKNNTVDRITRDNFNSSYVLIYNEE